MLFFEGVFNLDIFSRKSTKCCSSSGFLILGFFERGDFSDYKKKPCLEGDFEKKLSLRGDFDFFSH